jgi:hypothetical protein
VLVHGVCADGSSWSAVTQKLQDEGFTVDNGPNPLRGVASDSAYRPEGRLDRFWRRPLASRVRWVWARSPNCRHDLPRHP